MEKGLTFSQGDTCVQASVDAHDMGNRSRAYLSG